MLGVAIGLVQLVAKQRAMFKPKFPEAEGDELMSCLDKDIETEVSEG